MAAKPNIDIIIPTYNAKNLLEKHLANTIANSPEINKVIIVDDGSPDKTSEVRFSIADQPLSILFLVCFEIQ